MSIAGGTSAPENGKIKTAWADIVEEEERLAREGGNTLEEEPIQTDVESIAPKLDHLDIPKPKDASSSESVAAPSEIDHEVEYAFERAIEEEERKILRRRRRRSKSDTNSEEENDEEVAESTEDGDEDEEKVNYTLKIEGRDAKNLVKWLIFNPLWLERLEKLVPPTPPSSHTASPRRSPAHLRPNSASSISALRPSSAPSASIVSPNSKRDFASTPSSPLLPRSSSSPIVNSPPPSRPHSAPTATGVDTTRARERFKQLRVDISHASNHPPATRIEDRTPSLIFGEWPSLKSHHTSPHTAQPSTTITVTPATPRDGIDITSSTTPVTEPASTSTTSSAPAPAEFADEQRRHWNYLVDTLLRISDELYHLCEQDTSGHECRTIIEHLSRVKDRFVQLSAQLGSSHATSALGQPVSASSTKAHSRGIWDRVQLSIKPAVGSSTSSQKRAAASQFEFKIVGKPRGRTAMAGNRSASPVFGGQHPMDKKLSSPERFAKKAPDETKRQAEERQARAQRMREQIEAEKREKLKTRADRVQQARQRDEERRVLRKLLIDEKLSRADALHEEQVRAKRKKAENENTKVGEIAFITTLSTENRKLSLMQRSEEAEMRRLAQMEQRKRAQEERERKKQEAALARRRAQEEERRNRLRGLEEGKRQKTLKKAVRLEAIKEKAATHIEKVKEVTLQIKRERGGDSDHEPSTVVAAVSAANTVIDNANTTAGATTTGTDEHKLEARQMCLLCGVDLPSKEYIANHLQGKKHRAAVAHASASPSDTADGGVAGATIDPTKVIATVPRDPAVQRRANKDEEEKFRERERSMKKRARKIRKKMGKLCAVNAAEASVQTSSGDGSSLNADGDGDEATIQRKIKESPHGQRIKKLVADIRNHQLKKSYIALESSLKELLRLAIKAAPSTTRAVVGASDADLHVVRLCDGLTALVDILPLFQMRGVQPRLIVLAARALSLLSTVPANTLNLLRHNRAATIVDCVDKALDGLPSLSSSTCPVGGSAGSSAAGSDSDDDSAASSGPNQVAFLPELLCVLAKIVRLGSGNGSSGNSGQAEASPRTGENDRRITEELVEYIVHMCVIDKLAQRFATFIPPPGAAEPLPARDMFVGPFLVAAVDLIEAVTAFPVKFGHAASSRSQHSSPIAASVVSALECTSFAGILSLLVSLLLHDGPPRGTAAATKPLSPAIVSVALSAIRTYNNAAVLNLPLCQQVLSTVRVEVFHVCQLLISFCLSTAASGTSSAVSADADTVDKRQSLLNEVVVFLGYFCVCHSANQEILQWATTWGGRGSTAVAGNISPTLMQKLCVLPFHYFSDERYKAILFPTLLAACFRNYRNRAILEEEVSTDLIVSYLREQREGIDDIKRVRDVPLRFSAEHRFPRALWDEAEKFFSVSLQECQQAAVQGEKTQRNEDVSSCTTQSEPPIEVPQTPPSAVPVTPEA